MRIGIDYTPAVVQQAGIGRFTRDLVAAAIERNREHAFVLLGPRGSRAPQWMAKAPQVTWATLPLPERIAGGLWHRLQLPVPPVEWFTGAIDLFHATDYVAPPRERARSLITVHDLSFLRYPQFAYPGLARFLGSSVPRAVKAASLVLADSEFTRQEVIALLGAPPEKVVVVYGGVGGSFRPDRDPGRAQIVRARYSLARPYILTVGRLEPRKNIGSLVEAFRQLLNGKAAWEGDLAIAGARGWLYEPLLDQIERMRPAGRIHVLDHVRDSDLPALLTNAAAFVYPSYYEGFGLPPLEAMACGTPVVASDAGSLPEVLGDAALLVSPNDADALAASIRRVLAEPGLAADLRKRGVARAARFPWASAADQLLAAYERAGSADASGR